MFSTHGRRWAANSVWKNLLRAACAASMVLAVGASVRAGEPPSEGWDVYYMEGSKVGHSHTVRSEVEEGGRKLRKVENNSRMTLKRLGQTVTIELSVMNWETSSGDLVRFENTVKMANTPMTSKGIVKDGKLEIEGQVLGQPITTTVDCPAGTGGIDAIERSLATAPMKPQEKRTFRSLLPMFNVVADVTLTAAADLEETELLEGKKARLLRTDVEVAVKGQPPIQSSAWADGNGLMLKSMENAGMKVTTYRTTKEVALREGDNKTPDLINLSIVKIKPPARDLHRAGKVVYRAKLEDADPAKAFPSSPSQQVKSLGPREAEITVRPTKLDQPLGDAKPTPPTDDDRKPNVLIQSDDAKVVELAGEVAQQETDPATIAMALEKHVKESMKISDFSQALGSAAEVARTRRGDCTEHAVLLAALARARGIPARVAVGLVYGPELQGFAFHMWTEVWLKDRWVPLDGTLGGGGIRGGHLKLADSNLADGSPTSFLTVYQVLRKLKLDVVSAEE